MTLIEMDGIIIHGPLHLQQEGLVMVLIQFLMAIQDLNLFVCQMIAMILFVIMEHGKQKSVGH